jgi:hypothetical protein
MISLYVGPETRGIRPETILIPGVIKFSNFEEYTNSSNKKVALFHGPFPYTQEQFENKIDQALIISDLVIILISELHDSTVDFVLRYQNTKIRYFLCGFVAGQDNANWMDWFITSINFYQRNPNVLSQLTPYVSKPKVFDLLLGQRKQHRDFVYTKIKYSEHADQVILTYISDRTKPIKDQDNNGWIWEEGIERIPDDGFNHSVTLVKYLGQFMHLSQIIPISIYNQTAYSVVCETNFDNYYSFYTEKIVKPILAKRLFVVFSGQHYLRNLRRLGFQTFNSIIDESYDNESDKFKRWELVWHQMSYLFKQDQQIILEQIKPIVEYNYHVMMETDWYGDFAREFQSLLLDHTS